MTAPRELPDPTEETKYAAHWTILAASPVDDTIIVANHAGRISVYGPAVDACPEQYADAMAAALAWQQTRRGAR